MRLTRRSFAVGFAAALIDLRRAAADDDLAELLRRIGAARSAIRSLRCPFRQSRTISVLATAVESRGTMTLVRPDRLRWDLLPPDDVTFWVGPEGLAYRSAHGHGAIPPTIRSHLTTGLQDLRTLLGGDLESLRTRWILRTLRDDSTGVEVEAVARPPATAGLREIRFGLAPDLLRPRRASLVQGAGDATEVEFGETILDPAIDDALMRPPM